MMEEQAQKIERRQCDVLVIGGGPAGSTIPLRVDGINGCEVQYISPTAVGATATITANANNC